MKFIFTAAAALVGTASAAIIDSDHVHPEFGTGNEPFVLEVYGGDYQGEHVALRQEGPNLKLAVIDQASSATFQIDSASAGLFTADSNKWYATSGANGALSFSPNGEQSGFTVYSSGYLGYGEWPVFYACDGVVSLDQTGSCGQITLIAKDA